MVGRMEDWDAVLRDWLATKRRNTARAYGAAWREFFAWAEVAPWEITPELAHAWAERLHDSGLASSTANLKLSALSSFYDAVGRRAAASGPTAGPPLPGWEAGRTNPFEGTRRATRTYRRRARSISPQGARAILAAINTRRITGARDYALLLTLLATGHHVSTVLNLRWGDLEPLGAVASSSPIPAPTAHPRRQP